MTNICADYFNFFISKNPFYPRHLCSVIIRLFKNTRSVTIDFTITLADIINLLIKRIVKNKKV